MKKYLFFAIILIFGSFFAFAELSISKDDVRLEYEVGANFENATGFHLFIRKKSGMESVMLTESTKDPDGNSDNYAYRALEYNKINGDEIRFLDGKKLESEYSKYSLIDSTAEDDPVFGKAFHIYIPSVIQYGYPWTRNGKVKIDRGTFINIRTFSKKYCDYDGSFLDNSFMFNLGEPLKVSKPAPKPDPEPEPEPVVELTDDYNQKAKESFEEIAGFNGGKIIYSKGPESIIDDIEKALDRIPGDKADIVFCIDATGSMKDDIDILRNEMVPALIEKTKRFEDCRIGLVLYRDYGDGFLYKQLPVKFFNFTKNMDEFLINLKSFKIMGTEGGDVPEAVYEALYAALNYYVWRKNADRRIILIGDAEPHPRPRGIVKVTKENVANYSKAKDIVIDAIILPDGASRPSAVNAK